jgi:radical SAM enzyme (TIGR01210 family)
VSPEEGEDGDEGGEAPETPEDSENEVPRPGRSRDPRRYVACWSERDSLDGLEERAWVLILRTSGCRWARCSMCGYHGEASACTEADLLAQFGEALQTVRGERIAKLYTSGSFLDEREVPAPVRQKILGELGKRFARVVVESRPEFISREVLDESSRLCGSLEVAMGLESASPRVLSHSVRKGFTFADFEEKARLAHEAGVRVRTYLLLKPPFLNEREAMQDAVSSALAAAHVSDTISINPVNIQRGTMVEQLWKRGLYRPPWLWSAAKSVLDAHAGARALGLSTRFVCAPSGGGRSRGARNCGLCDAGVLNALEEFSLKQEPRTLEAVLGSHCQCQALWHDALDIGTLPVIPWDALQRDRR